MVSHQYKCIYIHIPKTAGTSIEYALGLPVTEKRNQQDHRPIFMFEPGYFSRTVRGALRGEIHPLKSYMRDITRGRKRVSAEQYQSYFKFAFVRNPWARVFSWYRNIMRDEIHQKTFGVPKTCTFDEYVHTRLGTWWLKPQLYWLTDSKGAIVMDFIGRYERLAEDYEYAAKKLGLKESTLPRHNGGQWSDYQHAYNDETKAIVARTYAEEIERFEYVFERKRVVVPVAAPASISVGA